MRRVPGWLTRLFGKRAQAESAPASASPEPPADRSTAGAPTAAGAGPHSAQATASPSALSPTDPAVAGEAREVCPTCGKTSVFAGPPGHRYCMHCALRQELFDASAAARQ